MPMKVTVCFDRVKVLVPCGAGDFPVGDLINKAITRYKKAIGKTNDYWVSVNNLRTVSGDGILDPDDLLNDVVDDREQIIADYEEQGGFDISHNGDGASSSVGTSSPEMFHSSDSHNSSQTDHKDSFGFTASKNDVFVTSNDLSIVPTLTVRHGSEPTLNILTDESKENGLESLSKENGLELLSKENGLEPLFKESTGKKDAQESSEPDNAENSPENKKQKQNSQMGEKLPFNRFSRDSNRQSLGTRPEMFKWLEAQEKQQDLYNKTHLERHDPVGSTDHIYVGQNHVAVFSVHTDQENTRLVVEICLDTDGGPLGIHVVPDLDSDDRETGLVVQSVERGGRVDRNGWLRVGDSIIEINGTSLVYMSFGRAQEIFRSAMKTSQIKLKVKKIGISIPRQPPPTPKGHTPIKSSPLTLSSKLEIIPASPNVSPEKLSTFSSPTSNNSNAEHAEIVSELPVPKPRTKSPGLKTNQPIRPGPPIKPPGLALKKTPPAVPTRNPNTALSPQVQEKAIIAPTNTRKIGKKIELELQKGSLGLGFSVTTRDNPAGGQSPIYIKNILPKGAAIADGRLVAGDRLLEVNGIDMTEKSQAEAVAILRQTKLGSTVFIVVSRQDAVDDKFKVPRELNSDDDQKPVLQPTEKAGDDGTLAVMNNKKILSLQIPLNESGSAGLGVSVKGKTNPEDGTKDLGIFIKAVIHGGAASKDGRLQVNDQLMEVNGESLVGLYNTEAMEILREAMHKDGTTEGLIDIKIARKIGVPSPYPSQDGATMDLIGNSYPPCSDEAEYDHNGRSRVRGANRNIWNADEFIKEIESSSKLKDNKIKNPAFSRLSEQTGLRNESYSKAVNETFSEAIEANEDTAAGKAKIYVNPEMMAVFEQGGLHNDSYARAVHGPSDNSLITAIQSTHRSCSVSPTSEEIVLVVNDEHSDERNPLIKVRPHSTIGFLHPSRVQSLSSSSDENDQPPTWLHGADWDGLLGVTEAEISPFADEEFVFSREGFGRQSMSEKRRGHLDPRTSGFYQKAKSNRETSQKGTARHNNKQKVPHLVRVSSAESLLSHTHSNANVRAYQLHERKKSTHTATNLKRFNSLENLTLNDDSTESEEASPRQENKVGRGRGCNESFRAAVDRSYDVGPTSEPVIMDTLEEESSENGSMSHGLSSARSSVSSEHATNDDHHRKLKQKSKEKKSGGIFKGLFRIGKGKRSIEEPVTKSEQEREIELDDGFRDPYQQRHQAWKSAQEEREKQEQYRKLQEQQHLGKIGPYRQASAQPSAQQYYPEWHNPVPKPHATGAPLSKAEKIQQLRAKHQFQHQQRQGKYPNEDQEEYHERLLQEDEAYRRGYLPPGYQQGSQSHLHGERFYERSNGRLGYPDLQGAPIIYEPYPSDSGVVQPYPKHYSERPSAHSHYAEEHSLYPGEEERIMWSTQRRTEPPPGGGYYGDPVFSYRDPIYPAVAGKPTISQPGSAKV